MQEMKEEIYEASLSPEMIKRMRGAVVVKEGSSAYGTLDNSLEALKTRMKAPSFKNERMCNLLTLARAFRGRSSFRKFFIAQYAIKQGAIIKLLALIVV